MRQKTVDLAHKCYEIPLKCNKIPKAVMVKRNSEGFRTLVAKRHRYPRIYTYFVAEAQADCEQAAGIPQKAVSPPLYCPKSRDGLLAIEGFNSA